MADTGFKYPTSNGQQIYTWPASDFNNPTNAYTDDGTFADYTRSDTSNHYHSFQTFNFNLPACKIDGITIEIKGYRTANRFIFSWVGNDNATAARRTDAQFSTFDGVNTLYTYGGASNLLNFTGCVPNDFSNENFYYIINEPSGTNDGATTYLDFVRIKIHYTPLTGSLLPFFW